MFYYYEKDQKILASERNDLPYAQGKPIPGAPIYFCPTPRESPSPAPPSITWWRATRCWAGAPSR